MSLKRRVDRLSDRLTPPRPPELHISPEDRAIMVRIVKNYYSDPVRYAKRIQVLEQCPAKCEGGKVKRRRR